MFSKLFKSLPLFVSALALVVFISCKDEKKDQSATETSETPAQTTNSAQNNTSNNNGDVALNPAHGQPGHRCDIPVGQPLNSGSSSADSPVINSTQSSPVINNNGNVPVNNNTTSGNVNPPHGQPGHNCDIPVGAPLN